ncbi:DUF2254 domain-containing protein [Bacillaceae bacterium SIJ1]|uniref:DUF2254 domain-containing protein n=1 Tax=Litoribacterium kuwaitense TaxID=1398745 RepID=UPI0013EB8E42|nr:DUF2254 domain-containing protein [Litoribacterium kuwaitense]NGP45270.1 DUF2254 domain-containing protein [Litoribacterium kuwaitense]
MQHFQKCRDQIVSFIKMSTRERQQLLFTNLWMTPALFSVSSLFLFGVIAWADLVMKAGESMPSVLSSGFSLTQSLLSTLTGGLLSLTSFTFYGVLTALTTFSSQFSPRILKNFMLHRITQRTLGIFIGSFLFVLLCLLFVEDGDDTQYSLIPLTATLLALLSLSAFVLFINHIVNWLQITNMTSSMKEESTSIIETSMLQELDPYRVTKENAQIDHVKTDHARTLYADQSGYLITVNFRDLLKQAEQDNLVIQLQYNVGNYVFGTNPLLLYWGDTDIDRAKYLSFFRFGKNRTEIQDIEFSLNKFVEIAIRALGNYDPRTAIRTFYEIGDLLIYISQNVNFSPYLNDSFEKLRLILQELKFEDYLYIGFASIRHYARGNVVVTVELLKILDAIAKGACRRDHEAIWSFAVYTARGFEYEYMHNLDKQKFYDALHDIAETTGNAEGFEELLAYIQEKNLQQ